MRTAKFFLPGLLAISISLALVDKNDKPVAGGEPQLKEETIIYTADNVTMKGFLVYDENKKGPRPGILVVHEWWGLNDYDKMRARELAKLGYIALAVEMYGDGKTADNPDDAGKLAMPFYQNIAMAKKRFDAALMKLK